MLAFPGMIADAAVRAGIKVPDDLDEYDPLKYPHWHIFCSVQLGTPCKYPGVHFDNAEVIARVPDDKITQVSLYNLINDGLSVVF